MRALLALFALAVGAGGCAPPSNWTDLHSMDELEAAFNRDRGNVRVVLILSPT